MKGEGESGGEDPLDLLPPDKFPSYATGRHDMQPPVAERVSTDSKLGLAIA